MTGDLVKWLRDEASFAYERAERDALTETADRIEALTAENERLRYLLREVLIDDEAIMDFTWRAQAGNALEGKQ